MSFGVYNSGEYVVTSPTALNDGKWHHVVGTLSANGLTLYVDGRRVGTNGGTTQGQHYQGYWRLGGDSSWNGNTYFQGDIDEAAIYPNALSLSQVRQHYVDSGRSSGFTVPTDSYGKAVYNDGPDLYYRLDEAGGTSAADASGNDATGVYSGGETFGVASPVVGDGHTAVTFDGASGTLASNGPRPGPTDYSEELWFKTTTDQGGKLIGFGNAQSGLSSHYDRHVYMLPDGRLAFGTWTGTENVATTTQAFNDGRWHYVVATQGSDGMKLYVDSSLAATNPQTGQESYDGYWRIGGDSSWAGSNYFAGTIDEAAVYPIVLSPSQISAHFAAAAIGNQPPTAAFTSSVNQLTASFDGSGSSDSDGSVASYAWDFGDGSSGSGVSPSHTYGAAGTYSVKLTVTDNGGATDSVTHQVSVTAPPANQPPTAAFTSSVNQLTASFDGSGSSDSDGSVASYAWDFGDGSSGSGVSPSHTYGAAGTYSVKLTVTDNGGATDSVTHQVSVTAPPANQPPTAAFTSSVNQLTASFDGSGSSDSDGSVASYAWDFGDGSSGSGVSPSHTYGAAGTYSVKLTVTDNGGATDSVTHQVSVTAPPANQPPTAAFTSSVNQLTASFDGSGSSDSDGSVASYAWDFGDGSSGSGVSPSHTYGAAGTYSVKLTVTDNGGATDSVTHQVSVTAPPANQPPTAAFTSSVNQLTASFDGSGSSDSDGSVASYAWDFGDGSSGSGVSPSHTYGAAGTYSVKLTVTDNGGATDSVTHQVSVTAPTGQLVAADEFDRTVQNGWGTAATGGDWTRSGGHAYDEQVAGGQGSMTMAAPGRTTSMYLNSVSTQDETGTVDLSLADAPTGGGVYAYVVLRQGANGSYRVRVRLQQDLTELQLTRVSDGSQTTLKTVFLSGLVYHVGDTFRLKFRVSGNGTTTLQGKVWNASDAEPSSWQASVTDTTAGLQRAGGIGLLTYLSGASGTGSPQTAYWDNLAVKSED